MTKHSVRNHSRDDGDEIQDRLPEKTAEKPEDHLTMVLGLVKTFNVCDKEQNRILAEEYIKIFLQGHDQDPVADEVLTCALARHLQVICAMDVNDAMSRSVIVRTYALYAMKKERFLKEQQSKVSSA